MSRFSPAPGGLAWSPLLVLAVGLSDLCGQEVEVLPETVIVAERLLEGDDELVVWDADEIAAYSPRTLDELLANEPSFSLYRRQTALFGNPTSAGVSLRRTGATAAARTLVLRDGIPQNDPFGGWISWARYRPDLLSSARIVPAARAAAWGNQSPAGIVQLTSREPRENSSRLHLSGGSQGTRGLFASTEVVPRDSILTGQITGFTFRSDGFHGLRAGQRGAVDRRLDLETRGAEARLAWRPSGGLTIESAFSYYEEERGNGTVLARNSTEAFDFSVRVTQENPEQTWQALVYYQRRDFQALFSSVDATRSSESPALDQFDVPGEGIGGGVTSTLHPTTQLDLLVGADVRHLRGETNENAGFVKGAFLRRRRAGGVQTFGGVFARSEYRFGSVSSLDASARLDFWSLREGERVERSPASGALLRSDRFANRDGLEPSVGLALRHPLAETLTLTASAGSSFRLPTINELYRPFRVRNDITEANPGLEPERFLSLAAGARWTPEDDFSLELSLFHNWIGNAIANVPIGDPGEAMAIAGFVPPGGTVAQRRNVEEARAWGLEARARWQPSPLCAFTLTYLFSRSEFTDSPDQPLLEGKRFPQAPAHRLVAGLESNPLESLGLLAQVDFGSGQYDDALEVRHLPSWWSVRLGAELTLSDGFSVHARVENLFDQEITTGLGSSGLRSIGVPRSFWMDVRYQF